MILEIALIDILPGTHAEFEAVVATAVETVLRPAAGFVSFELRHGVEHSDSYVLLIGWATLEDHTVGFRESERFVKWRELIGPFFAGAPRVDHWSKVFEVAR
ncbi:MAG: antibiotic biosynthesis monooxygenase [Candidatus Nanopelagicales bacterium]|nr:antibiotic biosynthesis monooxygenase [Candidatus Nanopelagicales bacterium]